MCFLTQKPLFLDFRETPKPQKRSFLNIKKEQFTEYPSSGREILNVEKKGVINERGKQKQIRVESLLVHF
jgi:hypothetical protein